MDAQKQSLWDLGQDDAVSVNQRALIDKVLARYSGENTIFRELLQNSDDAEAKSVQLHFFTAAGAAAADRLAAAASSSNTAAAPADGAAPSETGLVERPAASAPQPPPDLKTAEIERYVFKNDGLAFRPEDWARLKKIAEGNPDESKVGAFGVGFYSLFSVTEEPWVESGGKFMGFHWKGGGDQLFARSGALPADTPAPTSHFNRPFTTFSMALRSPSPLPSSPLELARFLATSITFMRTIERAELFVDGLRLVLIERQLGPAKAVDAPAGLERQSKGGIMFVSGLSSTDVRINASILRLTYTSSSPPPPPPPKLFSKPALPTASTFSSMFSSVFRSAPSSRALTPAPAAPEPEPPGLKDPLEVLQSSLSLRIVAADVRVSVSRAFGVELERATKKPPPKRTSVALVFTGREAWEEGEASDGGGADGKARAADDDGEEGKGEKSVFRGLRADLDGRGLAKVFIGHATGQTTGMAGHLSARFIPTVERESIDLVDRHVAVWNRELLHVSGFLCRAVYEMELASIGTLWAASSSPTSPLPPPETVTWLTQRFVHALRFFSFFPSTPSGAVAREMELAFFACAGRGKGVPFLTAVGVRDASAVRLPQPAVESFVKKVPVVPASVLAASPLVLDQLKSRGMLRDLSLEDVINELKNSVLDEAQMVACLHWWILLAQTPGFDPAFRRRFLDVAVYSYKALGDDGQGEDAVLPLGAVQHYPNPKSGIPVDLPLPGDTLPFSTSKTLPLDKLPPALGFKELSIPQWLSHLASDASSPASLVLSPALAERVLGILAKSWNGLSPAAQSAVFGLLSDKTVVPTRAGMSRPGEAYHPNVSLFPDLPVVAFSSGTAVKGQMEKMLVALGVRRHVELQLVFSRLLGAGGWGIVELVKYLVSVRESLTPAEMAKLRETPAFPQQGAGVRCVPVALYEPSDELKQSGLPLPFLDWPAKWRSSSDEAKLLFDLGLLKVPPVDALLALAADQTDAKLRALTMSYLTANFAKHYSASYWKSANRKLAFLPCIRPDGSASLDSPLEVYTNPACTVLGFSVVASSAREFAASTLKVPTDPPSEHLVAALLRSPPKDVIEAQRCFEYLGGKVSNFTNAALLSLNHTLIVPVLDATSRTMTLRAPKDIYLSDASAEGSGKGYKSLFTYVDFGSGANIFLRSLGVKDEPSPADVAALLVSEPQHFLQLAGTPEAYLDLLRSIGANVSRLPRSTLKAMANARVLLCHRRVKLKSDIGSLDEDDYENVWELAFPHEIVILDEPVSSLLFVDELLAAPEEVALEEFYLSLGAHRLSKLVTEEWREQGPFRDQAPLALNVKQLVLERLPIFLHERPKCLLNYATLQRQLEVFEARALSLRRTLAMSGAKKTNEEAASAAAFKEKGRIRLLVSSSVELDLYEVASAVVKVLLASPRATDALLLHTLISTPLPSLKRRGFNTDRILKQKRAERLAEEALASGRAEEVRKTAALEKELQAMFPNASAAEVKRSLTGHQSDHIAHAANTLLELEKTRPPPLAPTPPTSKPTTTKPSDSLVPAAPVIPERRTLTQSPTAPPAAPPTKPQKGLFSSIRDTIRRPESRDGPLAPGGLKMGDAQQQQNQPQETAITPQDSIKANVEKAVNASRGNRASSIVSHQRLSNVKEAQEDYCSVDGAKTDLVFVADLTLPGAKMQFFADRSLPGPRAFLDAHSTEASRFAAVVILPLCAVYKMDPASLHMFYDTAGPLIAFNRNGSIFVNLRYYMAWHDVDVKAGVLEDALISWYFTLSHELAHNIVLPHNAQHSYWFSSISEKYLQAFTALLAGVR